MGNSGSTLTLTGRIGTERGTASYNPRSKTWAIEGNLAPRISIELPRDWRQSSKNVDLGASSLDLTTGGSEQLCKTFEDTFSRQWEEKLDENEQGGEQTHDLMLGVRGVLVPIHNHWVMADTLHDGTELQIHCTLEASATGQRITNIAHKGWLVARTGWFQDSKVLVHRLELKLEAKVCIEVRVEQGPQWGANMEMNATNVVLSSVVSAICVELARRVFKLY